VLKCVELANVHGHEPHIRIPERRFRHRREVREPRANADDDVGLCGDAVCGATAAHTGGPDRQGMVPGDTTLARLGLGHRNSRCVHESAEGFARFAVEHAAASDDHGPLAGADDRPGTSERILVSTRAHDVPDAIFEELDRVVECLRLRVLRQGQRYGTGLGWRGQHAHGLRQRRDELLGAVDPVPVSRYRAEAVVHRDVLSLAGLELLQHRRGHAVREDVPWKKQDRNPVNGCAGGPGHHIGGARSD
jgi:hypothetical protein